MPRAIGRDRLDVAGGGRLVLTCDVPKGWRARSPATATSAEHPGSAIRWEDQFFEVLEVRTAGGAAVQYVLALWDDRHAMRVVEAYSVEAEADREAGRADAARRSDHHVYAHLAAPLLGCLPGHVQERLEREVNVPAVRLSLASALPLWVFGWVCLILYGVDAFAGIASNPVDVRQRAHVFPDWVLLFGIYLLAESTARLAVCHLQGRAIGTVVGTLLYEVWRYLGRAKARVEGWVVPKEKAVWEVESDGAQDVLDRYHLLEPAAGLLPAADQALLAERFGFDGLRWGRLSAIFLLVMFGPLAVASVLGALVVFQAGDIPRIAVFGGVALEQVVRLRRLRAGTVAPSVLGVLVRPFARPLLG